MLKFALKIHKIKIKMPKLDEAKERLMTLRFWLGIIAGVILSDGVWIANNYKTAELNLILLAGFGLFISCVGLFIVNKQMNKKYKEIRDLGKDE